MTDAKAAVEACLDNIRRENDTLKALITVTGDLALEMAEACDRASAEGRWLGLLHGMPIALKDNIDTAGVRTTSGAKYLTDHIPNDNAPLVEQLRAQGAVLIGKEIGRASCRERV